MSKFTYLLLIIAAVVSQGSAEYDTRNEQTFDEDESFQLWCVGDGEEFIATVQRFKIVKEHEVKCEDLVDQEWSMINNFSLFPLHERLRMMMFYGFERATRKMFKRFFDPFAEMLFMDEEEEPEDLVDMFLNGLIVSSLIAIGVLVILSSRAWIYKYSKSERPKIYVRRPQFRTKRTLNLRPKGL